MRARICNKKGFTRAHTGVIELTNIKHTRPLLKIYNKICRVSDKIGRIVNKMRPLYFYFDKLFWYVVKIEGIKMFASIFSVPAYNTNLKNIKNEEPAFSLFKSLLRKNMVVVDAGAGSGWFTLKACSKVGEGGMVFSFEPDECRFKLLVKNIELNGFRNVCPINRALNNQTQIKQFVDYFDLAVIDVEGYELDVLKGLRGSWKQGAKIICEIHPKKLSTREHQAIYDFFANHNFNLQFAEEGSEGFTRNGEKIDKSDIYYIFAERINK